jgi:hypothetical protein
MGRLFVSNENADLVVCYFVFLLQKDWRFSPNFKRFTEACETAQR